MTAAREFRMPSLGADMESATVVKWLVAVGDTVKRDDLVAEVETDKGVFDVDVREGGVVGALLVPAGTKVKVGTPILLFGEAAVSEPIAPLAPESPVVPVVPVVAVSQEEKAAPVPEARPRVQASPAARHLAEEHQLDLTTIAGSGPHGVITLADVQQAVEAKRPAPPAPPAPPSAPTSAPTPPDAGMRAAIAAAVSRSKREIPHYYLALDVDLRAAMMWLQSANVGRAVTARLLPAALLVKAIAKALETHAEFNGYFLDGHAAPSAAIHVGIVTALRGGGLLAPAIHDTNALTVDALNGALLDVVKRARTGGLRASELTETTISVTSLGDRGVDTVYGVIYPPQLAIIGIGTVRERPWAEQGMLDVRPVVTITLAADHRVSDGHRGALLLSTIRDLLQHPEAL
jgi:pyruvate dehydrogenase E2 component (dihydrolipoamide acetyltransferase)